MRIGSLVVSAASALLLCAPAAQAQMGGMGPGMGGMGGMGGPGPGPGSGRSSTDDTLPEVDPAIAGNVEACMERGERAFRAQAWLESIAYFRHVTQQFSYSVGMTARAELRLADIAFERGRWAEARGYYRNFVRFHPRHEQVEYAGFRVGLCAFKAIPGSLWVEPPGEERDQAETRNARQQMQEFLQRHPSSPLAAQASDVVAKCEERLAAHELYVAGFYAQRGQWKGVLLRTAGLVEKYPQSPHVGEALALSVEAHARLGDRTAAEADLALLVAQEEAGSKLLARARKALVGEEPSAKP